MFTTIFALAPLCFKGYCDWVMKKNIFKSYNSLVQEDFKSAKKNSGYLLTKYLEYWKNRL